MRIAFAAMCLLSACGGQPSVVGTWIVQTDNGDRVTINGQEVDELFPVGNPIQIVPSKRGYDYVTFLLGSCNIDVSQNDQDNLPAVITTGYDDCRIGSHHWLVDHIDKFTVQLDKSQPNHMVVAYFLRLAPAVDTIADTGVMGVAELDRQ